MTRYTHTTGVYFCISAWEIAEGEVWKNSMAEQTMHEELEEAVSMSKVSTLGKHSPDRRMKRIRMRQLCQLAPSNGDLAGAWMRDPDGMAPRWPPPQTWFDPSRRKNAWTSWYDSGSFCEI